MRCFPLPVNHLKKASYRIELDMKLDTGGLSPDRFVLILRRLLQAIVLGTHNQKSTRIRSSRKTESLSRDGRALLQSFRKDYPELTRRALSVAHIERLCTYHENLAENPGVLYQSDLRWDQKGLQDLFEDLADYLEDLEGLYHIEGEVRHKSGRLTDFFFGSDPMLWRVRFFTSESKLFAVAPGPKGPKLTAVDLLEHRTNTLEAKIHQRYSFDGLRIEIDGLPIAIRTENRPGSLRTQLQLNRMPDATRVGGKLWGFLDKNVIDFFIPSNIDQLTSDFLGTLTRGNEGQGSTIDIHFTQEAGRNLIHIQSRNEILDNGLIPFAYEMYRARFEPDRAVRNDIAGLLHLLERGLERDLRAPQKR
jgi:hypothetical protein